ncbi:MAG: cupin [SAR324 cluster bacterium]|jgi:mannose-6-phosphate isomerase-like protein (cupin superfamily)|uniref:Cupin 2 conserved barrel domain-containing protein n=1 Tax=marine metagenome TaxID=408172 RepID=A0A381NU67_9ZZZZ|nr:cupin [SAR324 cluster bacterium]HCV45984.1 cupin [Deltaproteobacteria bacterium]|tara:strand:- start:277 stop:1281 length:1005 start_codon:yes stop_codon:yes gene_type:complete
MKTLETMRTRLVRRSEMVPCKSAFIDAHTPGSHLKDNFSIIGPGVTENKEQFINIREPHGFNIGAAGQPPYIKNSLHSHFTAEVFLIQEGTFDIYWGLHAENHTILTEGDVVSIPTNCFRGFENIGDKYGFLFAILGGDDTGGVEWAPQVFEDAEDHGLVLLEDYGVWDTNKCPIPKGATQVRPMSPEKAATYKNYSTDEMELRICRSGALKPLKNHPLKFGEYGSIQLHRLIGIKEAVIPGGDEFELSLFVAKPGGGYKTFSRSEKEVLICYEGTWKVDWTAEGYKGSILLNAGDLLSVPEHFGRSVECVGNNKGSLYSVINENSPKDPGWTN